jgi:hypothetical protein
VSWPSSPNVGRFLKNFTPTQYRQPASSASAGSWLRYGTASEHAKRLFPLRVFGSKNVLLAEDLPFELRVVEVCSAQPMLELFPKETVPHTPHLLRRKLT